MQHAFAAHPGKDPEHMVLSYAVALSAQEVRILKPLEHKLVVSLQDLRPPLNLTNDRGEMFEGVYKDRGMSIDATLTGDPKLHDNAQPKWQLEDHFCWRIFEVRDIRKAYVFLRMIAAQVENSMILSMPLAPYYGFTRTFDVRFDVPKEISNFEVFRRSILAHGE